MIVGITINNILRDHISKLKDLYEFEFEKEAIEPINPFELSKSFPDIEGSVEEPEFKDDQEVEFTENKKDTSFNLDRFMYEDACFEVFGRTDETIPGIIKEISDFSNKNKINIILLNNESQRSKSATLFFLSKNYYNLEEIVFPKKWKDFWNHCDVLVTDNPKLLKTKPKDKVSIKYQNEFNIDIKSDYTIINSKELFKLLKKLNKEKNGKK
ncbi:MAG: hypothetical protein RLZ10_3166 [Bacteroidota bacterium]|jgi:hypothetical protein